MHSKGRNSSWVIVIVLMMSVGVARGADYPPADHGGSDLVLSASDVIWGNHTNVGQLVIPAGASISIRPFDGGAATGWLEVHADVVIVSGTLNARGAGFWGGAGGGGGGGASVYGFTGALRPGGGGDGGSGSGISGDGSAGNDGSGAFGVAASGGRGGAGGRGNGPGAGNGGSGGVAPISADGGSGSGGGTGGYDVPGGNSDSTTHFDVLMGSGGGGAGGGGGGGAGVPGAVGKIAGGGGGSGASGGGGGGAVKLYASSMLRVSGMIDTRGTGGGLDGSPGLDGTITLLSAIGGDGADGADAPLATEGAASQEEGLSDSPQAELRAPDPADVPLLTVGRLDIENQTSDRSFGGEGGRGFEDRAIGVGYDGGSGGDSGPGGGGGILLYCVTAFGMDLTGGTLDARGGTDSTVNGGTVKLFAEGTDPTVGPTILAGRILSEDVLTVRRWESYR